MKQYKREQKLSESFHVHAFHSALRPLLDDTRVILKEGETVPILTQRMQIINEVDTTYGRRIDILVACDLETDNHEIETCLIELKKVKRHCSYITATTKQKSEDQQVYFERQPSLHSGH